MKIKQCTPVVKNYIRVYGKEFGQLLGNHETAQLKTNTTLTRRKTFENQPFGHIIDTKKRLASIWRIRNNRNRSSSYKSLARITFGNNFSSMPQKTFEN